MKKALIQQARQANLAQYLIRVGVPLKQEGQRHRHKEHNSLVFTKNSYYWNSRSEHGNSIDYLVNHMGMNFTSAVLALAATSSHINEQATPPAKGVVLDDSTINENSDRAREYLSQQRYIDENLVYWLMEQNLIRQEKQTNNIIFPMIDERNNCVGAELQGVTSTRFKGIKEGSAYGYGFNARFSDDNTYDYALFFESAIDLVSFIDYKKNLENKSLERCVLVSMAGLKKNVIENTLKVFACRRARVVLCVDNDSAGQKFKGDVAGMGVDYIDRSPDAKYKDWNEQLAAVKQRSKPMQRLMLNGMASEKPPPVGNDATAHKPATQKTFEHKPER